VSKTVIGCRVHVLAEWNGNSIDAPGRVSSVERRQVPFEKPRETWWCSLDEGGTVPMTANKHLLLDPPQEVRKPKTKYPKDTTPVSTVLTGGE